MANNVDVTSKGIKKILQNYNPQQAIAEYIWNGFDANADTVELLYSANELGRLEYLQIVDNGYGIHYEKLPIKFRPFYESEKAIEISAPKHTSAMHGKNGVGRLTFFTFAHNAHWTTTYEGQDGVLKSAEIKIETGGLNTYSPNLLQSNIAGKTGTVVAFNNIQISQQDFQLQIIPFLSSEFCWFLELNKDKGYKILINGVPLDYSSIILDYEEDIEITYEGSNTVFRLKYIQWKNSLHKEFSKYYFLNGEGAEMFKDFTTLNKKSDQFYHSVYIQSAFFDDFMFNDSSDEGQIKLFGKAKNSPEYKFLIKKVNEFLRTRRKPFLRAYAYRLVEEYEQNGILPTYETEWEAQFKKPQLEETIIGLYEAQPKLFSNLNLEQKKTFVRFLDLLLESNERERIFTILEEIVELEPEEREDLADLFKKTHLNRIIETLKLIEDRYKVYYMLRDLVFNPDLKANEVDHLQKLIENHYWIFGEQYHLVTAAEPKFEEALRRYTYLLTDQDSAPEIEHEHRLKEMDIFACRQNLLTDTIDNFVVELKHPKINLGAKQHTQIYNYLDVISKQPEFNAPNMRWEFILVGCDFDSSGFIENQINTNRPHGIPSLILNMDNGRIKVYAKKWSEIFTEFEIKHNFLDKKLKLERDGLINNIKSAGGVIEAAKNNTAIAAEELKIPIRE